MPQRWKGNYVSREHLFGALLSRLSAGALAGGCKIGVERAASATLKKGVLF